MARLRSTAGWNRIGVVWLVLAASVVRAQGSTEQAVFELNRQAMEAYNALDINKAGSMLEQALQVASQGGVSPQLLSRTNLNLGIVYVGGLGDQNNGLNYFVQALCMDPSVQLDPLTSTPEVLGVFNAAMQRARGGACATGGGMPPGQAPPPMQYAPPQPVAPPPDQAIAHRSPAEQLSQTPLPLYLEISPLAQAKKIFLHYKGVGMKEWKQVPMYRFQGGFAYQLSCNDVWEPKVSYYIEAKSADGRLVGVVGSAPQPIEVPIVGARKQAEPALPGTQAPTACVAKECPPGVQGCKQAGKAAIGDSCSHDSDCQSGLECKSDACALIGAGSTEVPAYNPTTGTYDEGEQSESNDGGGKPSPNFVQLGLTAGLAFLQAGMVADRPPPDSSHIFVDPMTGAFVPDPTVPGQMVLFPSAAGGTGDKLGPWVPDADSSDSFGKIGGTCAADGKPSGPGGATPVLPTKYCVRVKKPGFVPNLALRLAIGRFITPKISLAALLRYQFSAGKGSLSHMLIGARAEYLFSQPKSKGLMISGFAGLTFGEIQAQAPAARTSGAPFVKSGMMGVHAGANFRYRLSPHFGLFASPELDVQLPTLLLNLDFTLAGVEGVF
jgi:hypothetical protein